MLPKHSHDCRVCGVGQMHLNYAFEDTLITVAFAPQVELTDSLFSPKGWRQETNPQVRVTCSRKGLPQNASS